MFIDVKKSQLTLTDTITISMYAVVLSIVYYRRFLKQEQKLSFGLSLFIFTRLFKYKSRADFELNFSRKFYFVI